MRHTKPKQRTKTLSIKVSPAISERVARLARERSTTVSAVVRDALERYDAPNQGSFAEAAKKYLGVVKGGPGDLATNPKHLEGFGR